MPNDNVSVDRLLTMDEFNEVKAVFDVSGNTTLSMVKSNVSNRISFNQIKIVQKILFGGPIIADKIDEKNEEKIDETIKIIRL